MNLLSVDEKGLRNWFVLLMLLAGSVFCVAGDQKKAPPAPKPSAPHASAPHASAPHASAPKSAPHNSAPSRSSNTRPSTGTRPNTTGSRAGTTPGARPGMGKTGTANTGKPGNSTVGRNTRGLAGNIGKGAPSGKPGGGNTGKGGNGNVTRASMRPAPGRQVSLKGGGSANIRPNGQIRSINRNGMHIDHGLNGSRRIESTHNGARVVTTGKGRGYVQRPYVSRNGRAYVSRTVVVNHVAYTTVYRSYSYGGYNYYGYHPAYYYGPAYYGWAYNPWPAPVYYGWGWGGAPWYGYYGGYFAPYPTYPSAAFWLTDYLLAASLQAAYQANASANAAANASANNAVSNDAGSQAQGNSGGDAQGNSSGAVTLTPEVKAAIAEEVKAQLAAEQTEAKSGASSRGQQASQASEEVPPALDPARRTFVVASDLAVQGDGQECQLTAGDVITRITDTPDDDKKVTVSVSASKKSDCAPGKQVAVSVEDLQEMHNHFQEQLDKGMKELSSKQGTGGLPKAPDATPVASDVPPPPPDASAEKALQDQQASADQVEAQVAKEAFAQGS